jgi:hypothetical protein
VSFLIRIVSQYNLSPLPQVNASGSEPIKTVLQFVFALLGGIAVLVITIAGFQFVLSRGDPQKTATAKNAIIYALVGLAVAMSAFAIVTFVIGKI